MQGAPVEVAPVTGQRRTARVEHQGVDVIERATIMCDGAIIDADALEIELDMVPVSRINAETIAPFTSGATAGVAERQAIEPNEDLSLEDYFQRFVLENQDQMNETELAKKLGISRKCLWERRQRLDIPRNKTGAQNDDLSARK